MRGNIHRRLEDLKRRAPKPQQQRPLVRPELREFLDEYAARKRDGCLTPDDEVFAARLKAEVKRRRAASEIG